jgi:hypothetical protein
MQSDIATLFEGNTAKPATQQPPTLTQSKDIAPIPTTNLIDLTDLEIITSEDHPMTLENDLPTSSGLIAA